MNRRLVAWACAHARPTAFGETRVRDDSTMSTTSCNSAPASNQFDEARAHLEKVMVEGLRHGFFEYVIACEIRHGGKRHLVIRAGMSRKFVIPEEEVPR
jgi:hypothetical protein